MSVAVSESITVQAHPDTVMDVIADFESYPLWQDEIKEVEILETDEDGWGTRVWFSVDAIVMTTSYTLAYTYADAAMSWSLVEGEHVRKIDGRYRLHDRGDGTTDLTYELELEPSVSLPKALKRKGARRIVDGALKGVKQRAESLE